MRYLENKGFEGLSVCCMKCKCRINNHKANAKCNHPYEKQVYRAFFKDKIIQKDHSQVLQSRNYEDAVEEFIKYKNEVNDSLQKQLDEQPVSKFGEKSMLISDCMARFIDYLSGEGEYSYNREKRGDDYIQQVKKYFKDFIRFLKEKKIDSTKLSVMDITNDIFKMFESYLVKRFNWDGITISRHLYYLSALYKYLFETEYSITYIPVIKGHKVSKTYSNEIVQDSELAKIIEKINPNDCKKKYGKEVKNLYSPYLKDAILLNSLLGLRRDSLIHLKFSDIKLYEGELIVEYIDFKLTKRRRVEVPIRKCLGVDDEIKEMLLLLGYEQFKGTDRYLIAPELTQISKRNSFKGILSKAFTLLKEKAGINKDVSFKHLRKSRITKNVIMYGDAASRVMHGDISTTVDHYLNQREIALSTIKKYRENRK